MVAPSTMRALGRPFRTLSTIAVALVAAFAALGAAAQPVRVGAALPLTGSRAPIGRQLATALAIWKDDVNAAGGLLGRPLELVLSDEQSNLANVAAIVTKLIVDDKADLLLGPYGAEDVAAALPVIAAHGMSTVGLLASGANARLRYPRYFAMAPEGRDVAKAWSAGFLALAADHADAVKTVALIGADEAAAQRALAGARANLMALPFTTVFDRPYPRDLADFAPILHALQITNPDAVYAATTSPDTAGLVRAITAIGLQPKLLGGALRLDATAVETQLGPLLDGFVVERPIAPVTADAPPLLQAMLTRYQQTAADERLDPLGYLYPPFAYAAGQVLAAAVAATQSLDQEKIAQYLHTHPVGTVAGTVAFAADGEWTKSGMAVTQFQGVPNGGLDSFRLSPHEPVLWPDARKTGALIFPYGPASSR